MISIFVGLFSYSNSISKMTNLPTPLFDRLLVKPISSEQNFGGLIIPDSSSSLKKGTVVSVGQGRAGAPTVVKVEQTVFYKQDSAMAFTMEGEGYIILFERDVLMVK